MARWNPESSQYRSPGIVLTTTPNAHSWFFVFYPFLSKPPSAAKNSFFYTQYVLIKCLSECLKISEFRQYHMNVIFAFVNRRFTYQCLSLWSHLLCYKKQKAWSESKSSITEGPCSFLLAAVRNPGRISQSACLAHKSHAHLSLKDNGNGWETFYPSYIIVRELCDLCENELERDIWSDMQ